jgi:hypothetical protein
MAASGMCTVAAMAESSLHPTQPSRVTSGGEQVKGQQEQGGPAKERLETVHRVGVLDEEACEAN